MKIATHNSGTGEKSQGFISWLLTPFCKCQSKTLIQQLEAGCRYFDIRIKLIDNEYKIARGLWHSKDSIKLLLEELNLRAIELLTKVNISITYEGKLPVDENLFLAYIKSLRRKNLRIILINVKLPTWKCIWQANKYPLAELAFKVLDGRSWHTYLPIPWLWKKIYYNKPEFNNTIYKLVDFL